MAQPSERGTAEGCLALIGAWVLGWPSGAVRAAVAMKGWEWFVADTFGVRPLGFVEAWGFFLLVSFATMQPQPDSKDKRPFVLMVESVLVSLSLSAIAFVSLLILAGLR